MTTAILLAAGSSVRMGTNKMLLDINGKTPPELCYEQLVASCVDEIIITASKDTYDYLKGFKSSKSTTVIMGGQTRSHSVFNALKVCGGDCDTVVIHDAARCLVTDDIINKSITLAKQYGSAIASTKIRDTVRNKNTDNSINREDYLLMQTPQSFDYKKIMTAYMKLDLSSANTDDCEYYKQAGFTPYYFDAGFSNQKLTFMEDTELFCAILKQRENKKEMDIRIGQGEDTHRLCEGRKLILGGVDIPYKMGLLGHSDADALCHSICDALLGAAALGDIGKHFPDTDMKYKDADSLMLLSQTVKLCKEAGYNVVNVDATIIAQEPKLSPFIQSMRENISRTIQTDIDCVSVKATTPEHTGPEGNLECITVRSCALLKRK